MTLFGPLGLWPDALVRASLLSRYTSRGVSRAIDEGRARLRPSRHRHSARMEARPPGMSQSDPREVSPGDSFGRRARVVNA
jgi:hypothetical protein